jgi:para-aminobenzoate synthetase component 1
LKIVDLETIFNPFFLLNHFKNERMPLLLESQMSHQTLGKYSFLMFNPFIEIFIKGTNIKIKENGTILKIKKNPFKVIDKYIKKYSIENQSTIPFIGGIAGFLGYELAHHIENFEKKTIDNLNLYDSVLGIYNYVISFDHINKKTQLIILDEIEHDIVYVNNIIKTVKTLDIPDFKNSSNKTKVISTIAKEDYFSSFNKIKAYIKQGDIYQINYTQRFESDLIKSPIDIYNNLKIQNPAPFAAYFDYGSTQIISCSPERFIKIKNNFITTQPMKGTIERTGIENIDISNYNTLRNSKKDKAELTMIIDLERNDLSKICYPGTVRVNNLYKIIPYPTVFQQIADINGCLIENFNPFDILTSIFPGGSITGAPKKRALEIISELEINDRNVYTGAIGYWGFDQSSEFNIAIRTIICHNNKAYYQTGGGITWDSIAENEYEECIIKGKALKRVLENE